MRSLLLVLCSATVIQPLTIIEMFGLEVWTVGFKHLPLCYTTMHIQLPFSMLYREKLIGNCPNTTLEIRTILRTFVTPKIQNFKYER